MRVLIVEHDADVPSGRGTSVGRVRSGAGRDGWSGLFSTAFAQSRNAMVLLDDQRRHVDANGAYLRLLGRRREEIVGRPVHEFVAGGPVASPAEWDALLAAGHFTGEADLVAADGSIVAVQCGASAERVTGRRLVLFVALSTSRWGSHFRRTINAEPEDVALSNRELEIVRLVALGSSGPRSPSNHTSRMTPSARTCATQ